MTTMRRGVRAQQQVPQRACLGRQLRLQPLCFRPRFSLEIVRELARVVPDLRRCQLGGFEDPGDAIAERRIALRLRRLGREIVRASVVILHTSRQRK
jgi:hypothetical protein